jgi:membrane protease YdiL (CAAX protease family)
MLELAPVLDNPFARIRLRWLAVWLLLSGLAYLGAVIAIGGLQALDPKANGVAVFSLWAYTAPLLWMVFVCRRQGVRFARLLRAPKHGNWLEGPALALAQLAFSLPSFMVLLYLISLVLPGKVQGLLDHPERLALETGRLSAPAVMFLFAVVAPVVEELLFRGMMFHVLASRWGVRPALLAVAALFAVLHPNPIAMFVFSLLLSALYLKSRTLIFPILCHMTNNAVPALLLLAMPKSTHPPGGIAPSLMSFQHDIGPALLATVMLGGLLVLYIERSWPRPDAVMPYFDDDVVPWPPEPDEPPGGLDALSRALEPPSRAPDAPERPRPGDSESTR